MKPKRVLIASFVLMVLGSFFIVGPGDSITGAVIGVSSGIVNNESNILFGFFLVWIAAIVLIGGVEEKVIGIKDLDKRRKQIQDFKIDYGLAFYGGVTDELKKRKKKASDLTYEQKAEVVKAGMNSKKDLYLGFLGIKNQGNVYGKQALDDMHYTQSGLSELPQKELNDLYQLSPEGTGNANIKTGGNIEDRLGGYKFADLEGKHFENVKKEVAKELNLDPAKIKSINDLAPLYNVVVNTRLQKEGLKKYTTNDAKFSDN